MSVRFSHHRNVLWIGLALVSCALPLVGVPARAESAASLAREGNELFEQERYEEAAQAYRRALEHDPASARIQFNLGSTLARIQRYGDAEQVLKQTATHPGSGVQGDALYNLGVTIAESAEAVSRETGQAPAESRLHQQNAPRMKLARLEQALQAFREALLVDPSDDSTRFNYEITLEKINKLREQLDQEQPGSGGEQGDQQPADDQPGDQGEEGQSDGQQDPQQSQPKPGQDESQSDEQSGTDQNPPPRQPPGQDGSAQEPSEEQRQEEGLEQDQPQPTATPNPTPNPPPQPPAGNGAGAKEAESANEQPDELTPEQMDAQRLLNLLGEESPEQFKQLFQFHGRRGSSDSGKDW